MSKRLEEKWCWVNRQFGKNMAVGGSVMEPEKNRYRVNDQVKNVFWFSLWIGKFT